MMCNNLWDNQKHKTQGMIESQGMIEMGNVIELDKDS